MLSKHKLKWILWGMNLFLINKNFSMEYISFEKEESDDINLLIQWNFSTHNEYTLDDLRNLREFEKRHPEINRFQLWREGTETGLTNNTLDKINNIKKIMTIYPEIDSLKIWKKLAKFTSMEYYIRCLLNNIKNDPDINAFIKQKILDEQIFFSKHISDTLKNLKLEIDQLDKKNLPKYKISYLKELELIKKDPKLDVLKFWYESTESMRKKAVILLERLSTGSYIDKSNKEIINCLKKLIQQE
jgi:hypothetical protein